jgi:hypothetical protein
MKIKANEMTGAKKCRFFQNGILKGGAFHFCAFNCPMAAGYNWRLQITFYHWLIL